MLNGEVVTKMTLFKGDQLSFKKPAAHAFSHNLIQFDTLEKCTQLPQPSYKHRRHR